MFTPKLGNELLSGVTRSLILDLLKKNKYLVEELDVTKEQVIAADEIWCSSSTNPIAPITEIDGKVVKGGTAGSDTLETHKLVSEFIEKF